MRTRSHLSTLVLASAALVAVVGGCRREKAACTLRQAKEDVVRYMATSQPAGGEEAVDPDRRRCGVVLLSGKPWGRSEPYTGYYASLLARDGDELVRAAAARALGKTGDVEYLSSLAAAMSDSSAHVRQEAAPSLGRVTGPAGLAALRKAAAEDPWQDVRAACASAMGSYPDMDAVRALLRCLDDRAFVVRQAARASLAKLAGKDYGDDPRNWSDWTQRSATTGRPVKDSTKWSHFTLLKKQ
jgi:hypothetical protein